MGETLLMRQAGEPSVEEILESIKKVIARDTREEAARARDGRVDAAQHRVQRDRMNPPAPVEIAPVADAQTDDDSVLELTEAEHDDARDVGQVGDETGAVHGHDEPDDGQEATAMDDDAAKPLVAETAVASMRESLAALALLSQPGVPPQIVRSGETSLEGLTRDLLRPMLADWLEKNLPAMVERLVAVEIARIAGKKG